MARDARQDPRAARSRDAILTAAQQLLLHEGPGAVTHQRIAEEAGIGRATVYRHFPTQESVLMGIFSRFPVPLLANAEAHLDENLRDALNRFATLLSDQAVQKIAATLTQEALHNPEARALRDRLAGEFLGNLTRVIEATPAWPAAAEPMPPDEVMAMLLGPIWFRSLVQQAPISSSLVDRLIRQVDAQR